MTVNDVLADIARETLAQQEQWGVQVFPSRDWTIGPSPQAVARRYSVPSPTLARMFVEEGKRRGTLTWTDLVMEEVSEAICARTEAGMRAELLQVAGRIVQWVQDIDRRARQAEVAA